MMHLEECLTGDTPIYIGVDRKSIIDLFPKLSEKNKLYVKKFNPSEFIGEELCLIKKIRCAHYFLFGLGFHNTKVTVPYKDAKEMFYDIQIASRSFHKPNCEYKSVVQYGFKQYGDGLFEGMLEKAKDEKNRKELCTDMLQMLALDIYMGQTDRFAFNYEFEEDKEHNIRLAPLYDFQYSVNSSNMAKEDVCHGDLYKLRTIEECRKLAHDYPEFKDLLESYLDEDLLSIIRGAYAKRRMIVPEHAVPYYQAFEQERKEKIKRIVY